MAHILSGITLWVIVLWPLLEYLGSSALFIAWFWFIQHLSFNHLLQSFSIVASSFSGKSDLGNFICKVILCKEILQIFVTTQFHMLKLSFTPGVEVDTADEGYVHAHTSMSARTINT